jgi:hypothetical protein
MIDGKLFARFPLVLTLLIVSVSYGCRRQAIESTSPVPDPTVLTSPTWTGIPPSSPARDKPITPTTMTATIYPTPSLPALTPTWTPLPTLPPEKAQELISELMETNNGCRLPCWWGITPGETSWAEARQFFNTFAKEIHVSQRRDHGILVVYDIEGSTREGGIGLWLNKENVIEKILTGPLSLKESFGIDKLLNNYGPPSEVLIRATPSFPSKDLPFIVVLFYPHDHFLAIYDLFAKEVKSDLIACPKDQKPQIILWSPSEEWTNERVQAEVLGVSPSRLLHPLDEVTDLRVEDFYQIFSKQDNDSCIETPVEKWE